MTQGNKDRSSSLFTVRFFGECPSRLICPVYVKSRTTLSCGREMSFPTTHFTSLNVFAPVGHAFVGGGSR